MRVHTKRFLKLVCQECGNVDFFCMEFDIELTELNAKLLLGLPFDYEQSERMINAFGAEKMVKVIDWEGMNVRCPI